MISVIRRLDICLKSFFVQAAFNPERMQNVGFLFALRRSLKHIWRDDPARFEAACDRASSFFNTHPYLAPAIMGMTLHVEQKVAEGSLSADQVETLKSKLAAPLNALGSLWFWDHLRLLIFLFAMSLLIAMEPVPILAGTVLYFAAFNYFHFQTRWIGLGLGLRYGADMVPHLMKMFPTPILQTVRRLCVFCIGVLTPLTLAAFDDILQARLVAPAGTHASELFFRHILIGLTAVAASIVVLQKRWLSVYQLLVLGLAISIGVARWL